MNKDGLVIGEIGECFPSDEEIRYVYKNGLEVNSDLGSFNYNLSNLEEELFLWAINWTKEQVIKKATLKLYHNSGKSHI
jgi:hypothetical protein